MNTITFKSKMEMLWDGNVPLAQTFWIYYVVVVIGLRLVAVMLGGSLGLLLSMLALIWAGFMVVPIWRSSDKYAGEEIFAILAKIAAILIALSVIGSVLAYT